MTETTFCKYVGSKVKLIYDVKAIMSKQEQKCSIKGKLCAEDYTLKKAVFAWAVNPALS